jgi:hypothetical protein
MIEAEPEAPTMMIEGQGKEKRDADEELNDQLIVKTEERQRDEEDQQDDELRYHHVSHNRAHEKAVLTLEERSARRAMMSYLER